MPCTTAGSYSAQAVLDRGEVGDRPAHGDERVGLGPVVEAAEVRGDGGERLAQHVCGHRAVQAEALREADRAHVDTEPLLDLVTEPEA